MTELTGVRAIMKDILTTLQSSDGKQFLNLSAGNPLIIPEVEELWRRHTRGLLESPEFGEVLCRYGSSKGYQPFIDAVIDDFNERYSLNLTDRNILVTPGSQSLYFLAANAFGGWSANGSLKKVLLPMVPEYTGYGGVCMVKEATVSYLPLLDIDEANHSFKYKLDLDKITIDDSVGCILLSRPGNPTGNIMSKEEVESLQQKAAAHNIPLFIDSAYSVPYPALAFEPLEPLFGSNIIHCGTLSKAGLPGERIGFALGHEQFIDSLEAFLTNACIHSSRYGQAIAARAIRSGGLAEVCNEHVKGHYLKKRNTLTEALHQYLPKDIPWFLHKAQGSIFAWLWFRDLPITDWALYSKLKEEKVIVVPGSSFFPGLQEPFKHREECIRISLTALEGEIVEAIKRIGKVITKVYSK